jgi:hypothetical protein
VDACFAAVFGDQTDHEVDVIRSSIRAAVTNRNPPALSRRGLADEPHCGDQPFADLLPSPILQVRLARSQSERAVPDMSLS